MNLNCRFLATLLSLLIGLLPASVPTEESMPEPAAKTGVSRCLVIGYDRFVTMPDIAPCSANNAAVMTALLSDFAPEAETVVRRVNEPATAAGLAELIRDTFRDAGEADTSFLYISTHGIAWDEEEQLRTALLLSDGKDEEALEPAALRQMLDAVAGQKVLILDACHSGALAGAFRAPGYRVLASCAPEEDSYFWRADPAEDAGTGYFTSALESALRASGAEQIDRDGNGEISLKETLLRVGEIYGASTPQGYAEDEDRQLFRMPEKREVMERVLGLAFDPAAREDDALILPFRFTVTDATRIEYRIVRKKNGTWDFDNASTLPDRERTGTARGLLSAGDKQRKIRISPENLGEERTALLMVISLRGIHGQVPVLEGTAVISDRPPAEAAGD